MGTDFWTFSHPIILKKKKEYVLTVENWEKIRKQNVLFYFESPGFFSLIDRIPENVTDTYHLSGKYY